MIGAAVRVTFTRPPTLAAVRSHAEHFDAVHIAGAPGDSLIVPSVTSVVGRIVARDNNAMLIQLNESNGATGKKTYGRKYVATVPRDSNATMQVLSRHPGTPHVIVLVLVVGLVLSVYEMLRFLGQS
jgi:hypothetical protein